MEVAVDALEPGKPLVRMKAGGTKAGAKAIAHHRESLAGEDTVLDGVIREKGIICTRGDEQLLAIVEIAAQCALAEWRGVRFITRSGRARASIVHRAEDLGLHVPLAEHP
jgi:acyl-CoA synthetase (NDP forming)